MSKQSSCSPFFYSMLVLGVPYENCASFGFFFTNCLSKLFLWFCLNKNLKIFKLVDCRLAQYNENLIIETEIYRILQI